VCLQIHAATRVADTDLGAVHGQLSAGAFLPGTYRAGNTGGVAARAVRLKRGTPRALSAATARALVC
jgi:hypothetical protein